MSRIAYMPLNSYPEAVGDDAVNSAIGFAAALGVALRVSTFAVSIPQPSSPLGNLLLDIPGMVRAAEERSRAECRRLADIARRAGASIDLALEEHTVTLGATFDAAVRQARYSDLSILPWSGEGVSAVDMAESIVFGSGRPVILVPPSARAQAVEHLAVAWDCSRVAARAVGDALALLADGSRITVLTVQDEKPLPGQGIAEALVSSLNGRGFAAEAVHVKLDGRTIGVALQEEARRAAASLLAMGGFGHSRLRDFVLGGATKSVLSDLRLPVLISH